MTVQFLRELIEKNARVILPDFGAFLVKDDGTGVFKSENITFSPFLRYNDGMVEDALSSKMSLSKDESSKQIKAFIETIKDQLLNVDQFSIEGLGYLYRDNRGGVHFSTKAIEKEDTKTKKAVKEKPLPKVEDKKIVEKPEPTKSEAQPIESKTEELKTEQPAKIEEIVENKEDKKIEVKPAVKPIAKKPIHKPIPPRPKPKEKIVEAKIKPPKTNGGETGTGKAILIGSLIGLLVVVLVAGGLYLAKNGYLNFGKAKSEVAEQFQEPEPPNITEQAVEANIEETQEQSGKFDDEFSKMSQEMDQDSPKEIVVKEEDEAPKNPEPVEQIVTNELPKDRIPTSDGPYHLIVGSFRSSEYAEKFSADMKKSGYNSTIVIQPSGMHAVTLGSYSTRQDAISAMDQFKSQHPNVWILTQ